ncbi:MULTISPECIES: DUF2905 domain-containing protein [Thermoactinomyces]|jgi:hypothetical protein|uniref:DUF2905 domain-containing protein n=1 Tax=Thermoactinomyces vulgaris TaxID=2026 RepID=A0ABS0QE50_THEVU|nr:MULTISPECIES: DUF2905 domain-containing protein [Thermoactinomyces]KFZ41139.1 hypothetical protein JS81_03450 [Thermoactinomyces sp. Gus2-1]KYQ87683.1 hypothetical protein AYX07_03075 [Thermoactinomyces sp. AS95]MBA4550246.1 DUF2905 domain-containing protein [Thermoactinomyces vulgaris]MBA4595657.1 DUF2905 domain-containing protein [Thermoactinomyces vulgaris]MBH8582129.1 DUF2905 domain-containing protein [Thermoactinomyces sp. CICC 10735]
MNPFAKTLIVMGLVLVVIGLLWQVGGKYLQLGKLPGDIVIEKGNTRFYFPIVTCIVISIVLSLLSYLFRLFR